MTVKEISRKELRQLKESYYTEIHEVVSYEELANIENLVSDEEIFEHYACTNFVSDDFLEVIMVHFNKRKILDSQTKGLVNVIRALSIAIAGKHNFLWISQTITTPIEMLVKELLPCLTEEEVEKRNKNLKDAEAEVPLSHEQIINRIDSSSVIADVCGGGDKLKGGLFTASNAIVIDNLSKIRSSVLMCFKVANRVKTVTLVKGKERKVFDADFQTFATTLPCPCGNYGENDKICLCSNKAIQTYWNRLAPVVSDTSIFVKTEPSEEIVSLSTVRRKISLAYEAQRSRGVFNNNLSAADVRKLALTAEAEDFLGKGSKKNLLKKEDEISIKKVAKTIADMDYREVINLDDIKEAKQFVLLTKKHYL